MLMFLMTLAPDQEDRVFLEGLYDRYYKLLFWAVQQYIPQEQDRADVVHDALVQLVAHVDKLRTLDQDGLTGYVMVTLRNTAYNYLQREQLRRTVTPLVWAEGMDDTMETLAEQLDDRSLLRALSRKMTEEERILLEGKFLLDQSDEQLAAMLHCKPESLRMKLTRARRNLRKYQEELKGGRR